MSGLYSLRREIRKLLLQDGLWDADEVLIKRRSDIWNDVGVATSASKNGQCIVVGTAKGRKSSTSRPKSGWVTMEITVPITILELPDIDPEEPADDAPEDEETRWEATVLRLNGSPLGRSPDHYQLAFEEFEDAEDDRYVVRQTIFKTLLILKP